MKCIEKVENGWAVIDFNKTKAVVYSNYFKALWNYIKP